MLFFSREKRTPSEYYSGKYARLTKLFCDKKNKKIYSLHKAQLKNPQFLIKAIKMSDSWLFYM